MLWIAAILLVLGVVVALVVWRGMDDGADPTASGSPSLVAVAWQDAHDRVGDDAVVEGPVMDVERSPMNADPADTYLNVGKVFHEGQTADPSRFYFVVPSQYDEAFRTEVSRLPGSPATPAESYSGHVVRVVGRIEENSRGEPFIEVTSTSAISLVE
jgi:hypothetical protein